MGGWEGREGGRKGPELPALSAAPGVWESLTEGEQGARRAKSGLIPPHPPPPGARPAITGCSLSLSSAPGVCIQGLWEGAPPPTCHVRSRGDIETRDSERQTQATGPRERSATGREGKERAETQRRTINTACAHPTK